MKKYSQNVFLGGALVFLGVFLAGVITIISLSSFADKMIHIVIPFTIVIGIINLFSGVIILEKYSANKYIFILVHLLAFCVNLIVLYYVWYMSENTQFSLALSLILITAIVIFEGRAILGLRKG